MRRINQKIFDPKVVEDILLHSEICRLGFIDNDRAYILPFNYGYKNNHIYIHCANKGKKLDLLKKNNVVCIEIEHTARIERAENACDWGTIYRSLVGYGEVEIITDNEQKRDAMDIIMKHYGADSNTNMEYDSRKIDSLTILKIGITEISGKQSANWPVK
ncbi:MAG TPA: pyridoxamine 5'-phosphate oxidase family protein [Bacteroidales bacterium]|nr:pyridoxamine 5'-phosphate oxidase family protein [Bacteroidales bacterium]HOU95711.1 pyridoxamine 5'-phosphate oxidase family protein [Bacteroidales bacterium]HQG37329.1 pyridoxamine 5'-phosphate oxidase family protein [Bacteroidales bacterium]HQG52136.1 pyridoxamine 5'-phosphate oxidase family protein [Bacteroidales bacterium]HQJ21570.1 pyridoxamine 5'-phosphate oxidase family protein [Bacteroidales bacterium]